MKTTAVIIVLVSILFFGCNNKPEPAPQVKLSAIDEVLRKGMRVQLYADPIAQEVGEYAAFGVVTEMDKDGILFAVGGANVAEVIAQIKEAPTPKVQP